MNITIEGWMYAVLTVLTGALRLATKKPRLTEEFGRSIEDMANFLFWPLLSAAVIVFWMRIEFKLLLAGSPPATITLSLESIQGRLFIVADVLMAGMWITSVTFLASMTMRWFSRKWNTPVSMTSLPWKRSNKPKRHPEVQKKHQRGKRRP